MRVHKIRKFQGSSAGEVAKIGREAVQEQRVKGKQPVLGGALLGALLARQAVKKVDIAQVAAEIWDDVTGGAGVVLVDGKPVKTATEVQGDKGEPEALT